MFGRHHIISLSVCLTCGWLVVVCDIIYFFTLLMWPLDVAVDSCRYFVSISCIMLMVALKIINLGIFSMYRGLSVWLETHKLMIVL